MPTTTITDKKPNHTLPFVFVSATEVQQNLSKYTKLAESGQDIIIEKNGKPTACLSSLAKHPPLLTSLAGILKGSHLKSTKDVYEEKRRHYENLRRH